MKEQFSNNQPSQNSSSSRTLFKYTLIHLPLLMTLLFIGKVTKTDAAAGDGVAASAALAAGMAAS